MCIILFLAPSGSPSKIMATPVSSTAIHVAWDIVPPIDQNGVITAYQILYYPLETFNGTIGTQMMTIYLSPVIITSLEEFVAYNISIRALNKLGVGPFSPNFTVSTLEDGEFFVCLVYVSAK